MSCHAVYSLTNTWSGGLQAQITVTITPYNATIAPSGSVTIGFTGTYRASNAAPASFAVNGTPCT